MREVASQVLEQIGRGDDPLSTTMAAGVDAAVTLSAQNFPEATKATLETLMLAGEYVDAAIEYTDEKTGKVVSTNWNKLDESTRKRLIGAGSVVSIFIPGGSVKAIRQLKAAKVRTELCFVAGTPVWTKDGMKPIENIQVGDLVMSRDEFTHQTKLKPVQQISKRVSPQILRIALENPNGKIDTLGTTKEHPFHVPGRGFVQAADLQPGDLISTGASRAQSPLLLVASKHNDVSGFLRVKSLTLEARAQTVYNFSVAETHTYFVGNAKAWVHNVCETLANDIDVSSGAYKDVGGHHVHAKAAFKADINYSNRNGFAISQDFMSRHNLEHGDMSTYQRRAFKELAEGKRPNTMREHTRIAVEALQAGGASIDLARAIVARSLNDLRKQGVKTPTNIPWYKP